MNFFAFRIVYMSDDGRIEPMQNDIQTAADLQPAASKPGRKRVVIVDDGSSVALALLDSAQPAAKGSRFTHRGRTWEISGSRQGSRVLVAEPVDRSRQ